jgi:hypothetical protein
MFHPVPGIVHRIRLLTVLAVSVFLIAAERIAQVLRFSLSASRSSLEVL